MLALSQRKTFQTFPLFSWTEFCHFQEAKPAEAVVEASEEAMEAAAEEKPGTLPSLVYHVCNVKSFISIPQPQRNPWRQRAIPQTPWKQSPTLPLLQWLKLKLHQSRSTLARISLSHLCRLFYCQLSFFDFGWTDWKLLLCIKPWGLKHADFAADDWNFYYPHFQSSFQRGSSFTNGQVGWRWSQVIWG